jgi:quinoprotein dehydrogenase-associated probable ABC transporter substrate-binding protein
MPMKTVSRERRRSCRRLFFQGAVADVAGTVRLSWRHLRYAGIGLILTQALSAAPILRVCADPNNLPFSSQKEKGLENRLAELLASDIGMKVEYVWWEQRQNFIDKSLNAGACDAIMGVPAALDDIAVTRPYYRSTYVWVEKRNRDPKISSLYDEHLKSLRIGVHIVDDSYAPPAQLLAQNGLAGNLVGFSLYAPARLIDAVSHGDIDIALAWGPLAGYFASPELEVTPVNPQRFGMVPFVYDIAVGVHEGNEDLRRKLDSALTHRCAAVDALVRDYRIPQAGERRSQCASALSVSASH